MRVRELSTEAQAHMKTLDLETKDEAGKEAGDKILTVEDINQAYRKKAKLYHPNNNLHKQEWAATEFSKVQTANDALLKILNAQKDKAFTKQDSENLIHAFQLSLTPKQLKIYQGSRLEAAFEACKAQFTTELVNKTIELSTAGQLKQSLINFVERSLLLIQQVNDKEVSEESWKTLSQEASSGFVSDLTTFDLKQIINVGGKSKRAPLPILGSLEDLLKVVATRASLAAPSPPPSAPNKELLQFFDELSKAKDRDQYLKTKLAKLETFLGLGLKGYDREKLLLALSLADKLKPNSYLLRFLFALTRKGAAKGNLRVTLVEGETNAIAASKVGEFLSRSPQEGVKNILEAIGGSTWLKSILPSSTELAAFLSSFKNREREKTKALWTEFFTMLNTELSMVDTNWQDLYFPTSETLTHFLKQLSKEQGQLFVLEFLHQEKFLSLFPTAHLFKPTSDLGTVYSGLVEGFLVKDFDLPLTPWAGCEARLITTLTSLKAQILTALTSREISLESALALKKSLLKLAASQGKDLDTFINEVSVFDKHFPASLKATLAGFCSQLGVKQATPTADPAKAPTLPTPGPGAAATNNPTTPKALRYPSLDAFFKAQALSFAHTNSLLLNTENKDNLTALLQSTDPKAYNAESVTEALNLAYDLNPKAFADFLSFLDKTKLEGALTANKPQDFATFLLKLRHPDATAPSVIKKLGGDFWLRLRLLNSDTANASEMLGALLEKIGTADDGNIWRLLFRELHPLSWENHYLQNPQYLIDLWKALATSGNYFMTKILSLDKFTSLLPDARHGLTKPGDAASYNDHVYSMHQSLREHHKPFIDAELQKQLTLQNSHPNAEFTAEFKSFINALNADLAGDKIEVNEALMLKKAAINLALNVFMSGGQLYCSPESVDKFIQMTAAANLSPALSAALQKLGDKAAKIKPSPSTNNQATQNKGGKAQNAMTLEQFFERLEAESGESAQQRFIETYFPSVLPLLHASPLLQSYNREALLKALGLMNKIQPRLFSFLVKHLDGLYLKNTISDFYSDNKDKVEAVAAFMAELASSSHLQPEDLESTWGSILKKTNSDAWLNPLLPYTYNIAGFLNTLTEKALIENKGVDHQALLMKIALNLLFKDWEGAYVSHHQNFKVLSSSLQAQTAFFTQVLSPRKFCELYPKAHAHQDAEVRRIDSMILAYQKAKINEAFNVQIKIHNDFIDQLKPDPKNPVSSKKLKEGHETFRDTLNKMKEKMLSDLDGRKINFQDAQDLKDSTLRFANDIISPRKTSSTALPTFKKDTARFRKAPGWNLLLSLLIGAAVACIISAATLGLGAPVGAVIGTFVGGAMVGALVGAQVGLWHTRKQDPVRQLANKGETLIKRTAPAA